MKDAPSRRATTAEQRRESRPTAGFRASAPGFWDEVEREIEALDVNDFEEFLDATEGPHEARLGFREGLREALTRFVRRRYGQ